MLGRRINSFAVVGLFFLNNAYRIRNRLPWLIHFHLGKHNYRERPSFSSYAEKSNLPKKISMMLWMQHDLIMFTWDDIDSVSFLPLSHIDSVHSCPWLLSTIESALILFFSTSHFPPRLITTWPASPISQALLPSSKCFSCFTFFSPSSSFP